MIAQVCKDNESGGPGVVVCAIRAKGVIIHNHVAAEGSACFMRSDIAVAVVSWIKLSISAPL